MADLLSDSDLGIQASAPTVLSDADVGISSKSFGEKLSNLWEHPPAGPSVIGAARSLYDAVMTPGRTMQAAEDQSKKTTISDSDIPLSSATMVAPAANMASNIVMPAPGAGPVKLLPKSAEAPAYGTNYAERKAADIVSAPLKERGLTTANQVEGALSIVGPEAVLADADPRLTQMAGTIAAKPGPAQQIIRDALEARNAGASDRILATTNDVMGAPVDLGTLSDSIHNAARRTAGPLWESAYKAPIDATPALTEALNTPLAKTALAKAATLAKSDINGPPTTMFNPKPVAQPLPDWAQGVMAKGGDAADRLTTALKASGVLTDAGPNVDARGLHLTRQALDDMISQAQLSGANNRVRILSGLRSEVDGALKSIPEFAQADKIYADKSRIQDAMAEGLNIFKSSRTPEDIAAFVNGMSEAERAAYRQAARVAVRNVMGTARNDAAAARGLFSKEFNQEKLAAAIGRDEAGKLVNRVSSETNYAGTDQRVLRNSETAARAYGKEALDGAHGVPSYRDVAVFSGIHGLARRAAIGGVSRVMDAAASGRQQDVEREIAKLLSAGRSSRAQILSGLLGEANRRDPSGRLSAAILPIVIEHQAAEDRTRRGNQARQ